MSSIQSSALNNGTAAVHDWEGGVAPRRLPLEILTYTIFY